VIETSSSSAVSAVGRPLSGRTVAVVHAAWHSCGSYQLNVSQLLAYRALGARVISIAVMDSPSPPPPASGRWPDYIAATADLPADARYFCGPTPASTRAPGFLAHGWWRLIHGDQATYLVELAKRAAVPAGVEREKIDLIHANHYFSLPLVARLVGARDVPVLLETQDIQARQYMLRNKEGFYIPPYSSYEDMLAIELEWMQKADICIHLNVDEHAEFVRLLPGAAHRLLFPAVTPVSCGPGGERVIVVASNNYANYMSIRWLLEAVLPQAPEIPVEIYGNIDEGLRNGAGSLYEETRRYFKGRVEDIRGVYAQTACVLLPTVEGHGLSIKAVEAMASGAPIIATRRAFRGMGFDPATLSNVTLADDAESFAAALRGLGQRRETTPRAGSDTRRLYEEKFSFEAYARALWEAAAPLMRS
jgi:glycosyltransferase involved in cell wall biosynthesis